MSSENRPVRKAWIRHARSLVLRRWLLAALGIALVAGTATAIVRHRSTAVETAAVARSTAPAPANSAAGSTTATALSSPPQTTEIAPPTVTASRVPPPSAGPSASPLRAEPGGDDTLTLPVPKPAPSAAASAAAAAAETSPQSTPLVPANRPVPDLPTVTVATPDVHTIPSDRDTKPLGTVTVRQRNGRNFVVVPEPSPPGPAQTAAAPPSSATPQPRGFAPVAIPAVLSGHARVAGPLMLDVEGRTIQLFGVTLAPPQDRCAAADGAPRPCAALAQAALVERLAGHSIVACRVPPGQRGTLAAICLDEQGNDLGRFLVIEGLALADTSQGYDYLPAEGAARSARRGLWRFR